MTLLVEKIEFERNDNFLFKDISFGLNAGEILQIKGVNGAGKTSLLRLLTGLAPITSGAIHWKGSSIELERHRFYQDLIYVGHQLGLKSGLTAKENLTYLAKNSNKPKKMSVDEALNKFLLQDTERQLVQNLSEGQKRRVALAKLALLKAQVWILDEPFSGLDVLGIGLICQQFEEHIANGGVLIVTSHQKIPLNSPIKELNL